MTQQTPHLSNIYPDIKNDSVIGSCASGLTTPLLQGAEDLSHQRIITLLSARAAIYFDIFKRFRQAGNRLSQLTAGDDITLEKLVSFGLAVQNGDDDPKDYKSPGLTKLLKYITGSDPEAKKEPLAVLSNAENINLGHVIKKMDDLAALGAQTLKAYQGKKRGAAGFNINFTELETHKGLPFGIAARGDNKKFIKSLADFLNKRIDLVLKNINKSEIQDFKYALYSTLAFGQSRRTKFLKGLLVPAHPPLFHFKRARPTVNGVKHGLDRILSTSGGASPVGFTTDSVTNLARTFIKNILEARLVINNAGTTESYKKRFREKFAEQCEVSKNNDSVSSADAAPVVGSALELKRRRLQNIRCVLPLFEELYSRDSALSMATEGITGVYSNKYQHILHSRNAHSTGKSQAKFFKDGQHPLLFAYARDSHFFINKLFNKPGRGKQLKTFMETTNTDISFLQPRIRVYKILSNKVGDEIEIPIEFSNKIELTRSSGVYERENAGIERVLITRRGQTPATFEKWMDVQVNLVFDSINAFTKCRTTTGGKKYSYVDFLRRPRDLVKQNQSGVNSIVSQLRTKKDKLDTFISEANNVSLNLYNPEYFQIKLEVGWSFNEQVFSDRPLASRDRRRLESFIDETNLVLYLTLQTHDFTFRNDGTVNLNIRYNGRTGSQLVDAFQTNIFHTPNLSRLQKATRVIDDLLSYSGSQTKQKNKFDSGDLKWLQEKKNQLLHKIEAETSDLTAQLWHRLVDAPINTPGSDKNIPFHTSTFVKKADGNDTAGNPTHFLKLTMPSFFAFFDADASKEKFGLNIQGAEQAKQTAESRVTGLASLLSYYRNEILEGKVKAEDQMKIEVVHKLEGNDSPVPTSPVGSSKGEKGRHGGQGSGPEAGDILRMEDFETQSGTGEYDASKLAATYLTPKNDKIEVYCLRYGSIVHAAIQNIWQFNPAGLKDIVIMLASTRFSSVRGDTTKHLNFADVPILFEDWKRFMLDKIVNKKVVNYAFIDFLRDSMNELLIPAMGAVNTGCKDGSQIASPLKGIVPRLTTFSARRQGSLKPNDGRISVTLDKGNASLLMGNSLVGNKNVIDSGPELKHFLVIYDAGFSTSAKLPSKGKNRLFDKNLENNIPHLFIGANKGIMRSISFKKSTIPFIQQAKVFDRGDEDFGLLREKYDCNVEVVGNAQFHQGMRFYLDPTFTGMSSHNVDVVQGVLGLGGYYDIVNVNSDITKAGFKTNIVGSWQAFHDGYDPKKRHIDPCKDK